MKSRGSMKLPECYRILNVAEGADWRRVKKAYYSLAKKYHPDLNPGDPAGEERFKEISQAFRTLEARHRLNGVWKPKVRASKPAQSARGGAASAEGAEAPPDDVPREAKNKSRLNIAEFVKLMPPAVRERIFGCADRVGKLVEEYEKILFPLDVYTTVMVDPSKANSEGTIKIRTVSESFEIKVPFGSWNALLLRVPEKGNVGLFNKKRGDLLLNIQVLPAAKAEPGNGSHNYKIQVPRQFVEKGKVMTLHTQEGPIKFFLPTNTADGQTFVLKSKPRSEPPQQINHIVTVHVI